MAPTNPPMPTIQYLFIADPVLVPRIGFITFLPGAAYSLALSIVPANSLGIIAGNMTPRQDPCQESSSVRQIRTAVIRRTPSPFSCYKQRDKSQSIVLLLCGPRTNSLTRDGLRLRTCFRRRLRGHNAPIRTNGEKPVPARSTSIGGNMKQA